MVVLKEMVLLLKTRNENSVDKYESLLKSNKIQVKLVNTLEFEYLNIDLLAEKLNNSDQYSGIIFSSPRCVQAGNLAKTKWNCNLDLWKTKDNFAVGEATALEALEKLQLKCTGQNSGAANNLVKHILKDKLQYKKPFLYPHGSLKTNILTSELDKEDITLDPILVYDTKENTNIDEEIKEATNNFQDIPEFVVFFSPSGLHSSIKHLRNTKNFTDSKLIAIGHTTETAAKEEGLTIYGVAKQPTPQNILDIILSN